MSTSTAAVEAGAAHAPAAARPPLSRLVGVELRKSVDTRAGFWLLLSVALVVAAAVALIAIAGDEEDRRLVFLLQASLGFASALLPIVGVLAVTSEWSQRTGLTTFALVPQRERVVAAKVLATLGLAALAIVACLVASALATAAGGGDWALTAGQFGQGVLYALLTMLAGVAFGLLFLNSALAIVLYFVLPIGFSILTGAISSLTDPTEWLDFSRAAAPLVDDGMAGGGGWGRLVTSALLWIGVPLIVGIWRLRRSELS